MSNRSISLLSIGSSIKNLSILNLGETNLIAGEICFFVFVSSEHRAPVFESLKEIVDEIKEKLPIFGKEIFEDQSYKWKVNQ